MIFYHSCGVDNGSYDSDEVEHVPRIPKVVLRDWKRKKIWKYFHISYLKFGTFNGVNCWGNICDTGIYLPFELHTFFHHHSMLDFKSFKFSLVLGQWPFSPRSGEGFSELNNEIHYDDVKILITFKLPPKVQCLLGLVTRFRCFRWSHQSW